MVRFSAVLGEKSRPLVRPALGAFVGAVAASIPGLRLRLPVPGRAVHCGHLYPSSLFAFRYRFLGLG